MKLTNLLNDPKSGDQNPNFKSGFIADVQQRSASYFIQLLEDYKKEILSTLLLVIAISSQLFAQIEAPDLVPAKRALVEINASMEHDKYDSIASENYVLNNTNLRIGVSKNSELQLTVEIDDNQQRLRVNDVLLQRDKGFSGAAIGGKILVCEEKGCIPNVSLVAHLQLPYFGKKSFRPSFIAPRFLFLCQHTLSDKFSLAYNLGAEWDGVSTQTNLVYNTSLGMTISDNTSTFIEVTGNFGENQNEEGAFDGSFTQDHTLGVGVTCLPNKHLQLDLSGGVGLCKLAPDYFLAAVLTIKIPTKNQF